MRLCLCGQNRFIDVLLGNLAGAVAGSKPATAIYGIVSPASPYERGDIVLPDVSHYDRIDVVLPPPASSHYEQGDIVLPDKVRV